MKQIERLMQIQDQALMYTDFGIYVTCGFILCYTLYYVYNLNYTKNPTKNMETPATNNNILTEEEIEAIFQEEGNTTAVSSEHIDYITDSDYDTDTTSDYQTSINSHSDNESEIDMEAYVEAADLFFMPYVDLKVCPIEELKLFEFNWLYWKEIWASGLTQEEIMEFLEMYKEDLFTNKINDTFLWALDVITRWAEYLD